MELREYGSVISQIHLAKFHADCGLGKQRKDQLAAKGNPQGATADGKMMVAAVAAV